MGGLVSDDRQMRVGRDSSRFFVAEQVIEDHLDKVGGNQNAFDPPET